MDIKPRRKRCEKGILRRKTERRKCYPQEIPEDKILLTFCPQTYHLLWIKIFSISAHLPTLSKKPITGVGVKSNVTRDCCQNIKNKGFTPQSTIDIIKAAKQIAL
jgi:hypothetical protein